LVFVENRVTSVFGRNVPINKGVIPEPKAKDRKKLEPFEIVLPIKIAN